MKSFVKVIAFDVFGTVFDLSDRPRGEIASYAQHLRTCRENNVWLPWDYPTAWRDLPAFADAAAGIEQLRELGHVVVTCSNGPLPLLAALSQRNGIEWDGIIPLEAYRVYKTDPAAYLAVCDVWRVKPCDVMMVTANKDFGDLEVSAALGMHPQLIRHPDSRVATITDLAEVMR